MSPSEVERARQEFERWTKPKLPFPAQLHERRGAGHEYNCHGLTFLLRRAWFDDYEHPEAFAVVLEDDGYTEIDPRNVRPGDIAVYKRQADGVIVHTGVVVGLPDDNERPVGLIIGSQAGAPLVVPWVLSKWGTGAEYLHRANNHNYAGVRIIYMREGQQ